MVQYLITGAAGMMGTHLYETLKSRGKDVLATYHQPTIDERDDFMKELERQEKLDLLSFSNVVLHGLLGSRTATRTHLAPHYSYPTPKSNLPN